jgi:hypothetical protein
LGFLHGWWLKFFNEIYDLKSKDSEVFKMNVEMITTLEQVKSMLKRAYNTAERQLRDPFGDKESVSSYLLSKIYIVTNEIDAFISEEENAFEEHYSVEAELVESNCDELHPRQKSRGWPDVLDIHDGLRPSVVDQEGLRFNPLIHACASEIAAAFGDCWIQVKAEQRNSDNPCYTISIQPDGYTPNDIQLTLKSLGYTPTVKLIKDLESCAWAYFDVSYNGITFELSSTVSSLEPPELERYSEPATDSELPF